MKTNALIILTAAVLLTACSGNKAAKPAAAGDTVPAAAATTAAGGDTVAVDASGGDAANAANAMNRTIYFDFDSSDIRPEFTSVLAEQAKALTRNASVRVRLEGNTDERGSPEYNVGLGERRAQAVRRALLLQGVAEAQLTTVSYGEERPAVGGSTEASWAKNRRVEIVHLN
jgi:peptidoglycan-associated lipoprotein